MALKTLFFGMFTREQVVNVENVMEPRNSENLMISRSFRYWQKFLVFIKTIHAPQDKIQPFR